MTALLDVLPTVVYNSVKAAIPVFILIGLGFFFGKSGRMGSQHVAILNQYTFKVAVAVIGFANIVQSEPFSWGDVLFILCAASMTIFHLFNALIVTLLQPKRDRCPRFYAQTVMMFCWPNSIIVGVPVLSAVYSTSVAEHYPILYVISNMMFSVPLFQTLQTASAATERYLANRKALKTVDHPDLEADIPSDNPEDIPEDQSPELTQDEEAEPPVSTLGLPGAGLYPTMPTVPETQNAIVTSIPQSTVDSTAGDLTEDLAEVSVADDDAQMKEGSKRPLWASVAISLAKFVWNTYLTNPFIILMAAGILWKLTGVAVPYPILTPAKWLASSCTPVGLFTLGVFIAINPAKPRIRTSLIFLLGRQAMTPLMMTGMVLLTGMKGERALAAIVCSSMPVALSSFTFSKHYENRTENVPPVIVGSIFFMIVVFSVIFTLHAIITGES
ncbi:Auxin efflux carrier [Carpediemonas membranifera]|uniref:Auxin efflux carrier n=1 Tax=Carpediemonas membranifera TaxID=201153 RepID=A0A8J6B4A6_9EUKA|nr:Auxin efflux carrier [Carpediemonas membranifera]|eukprot:KAG9392612.1 Auxin efflux carrier [Carpediemonas membranifera]